MTEAAQRIFSDDPIGAPEDDLLGRGSFIGQLADALDAAASGRNSTVFSLVGPWGSGKSSILSLLKERLEVRETRWDVVDFNPWSYSDEVSMQLGFFGEIQAVLPARGKAKKARKAIGRLSTSVAPYAGLVGSFVNVDAENIAKSLGSILTGEVTASKAFQEAAIALQSAPRPILLILDDLDRLDPNEVVLVAKLVRLVGRLPNVFYLLSYDEATLLDVLRRTPLVGDNETRAKEYLEKIIQVRFDIPPLRHVKAGELVNDGLDRVIRRVGVEVTSADQHRFAEAYQTVLAPRLRTLRSINRFFAQLGRVS